jgi:bla regulator protein BlaR1
MSLTRPAPSAGCPHPRNRDLAIPVLLSYSFSREPMLCLLYVSASSALLAIIGILIERILPPTMQRRWIWCLTIPTSIVLPGLYRAHHSAAMTDILQEPGVRPIAEHSSLNVFDVSWWAHTESYNHVINQVWQIASGTFLLWIALNALWAGVLVFLSRRQRDGSLTIDGIQVVLTKSMGPATIELFRARVLIPRWVLAMPGAQRQYVLRHEEEHRRSHDARLLLVASFAAVLMPWNPAMWWQLRRLRLAVEMDCDNRVVNALGNPDAYGELLLKVAEASNRGLRLQPAFLGGVGMLERRITRLVSPAPLRKIQKFLLPLLAVALLLVVLKMPHPINSPTHTHTMARSQR